MDIRDIVLLGAGRVGNAIARDLAADGRFRITVADASAAALERLAAVERVRLEHADLSDPDRLRPLVRQADLVVGAVPGPIGFETLRTVLEAGKHVVDISFFEEDAFELDDVARANGCIAIVDCGVAPGLSNLILGYHAAHMDAVERFWCVVGGLPLVRRWPFEYKAPFSPIDVIAEYTRPARFRRAGQDITMPALSEIELVDLPGVGTLEAFNTDGLRTLLRTVPVPDMVEKTLRYPGHAELMRTFRDTGFFATQPLRLDGASFTPLDMTARLLFDSWRFGEGEDDLTVMRVEVDGSQDEQPIRHRYDLLDRRDPVNGISSMARTTGYTCTAAVQLLAAGLFGRAGITPPELLARDNGCFPAVALHLEHRGINLQYSVHTPPSMVQADVDTTTGTT